MVKVNSNASFLSSSVCILCFICHTQAEVEMSIGNLVPTHFPARRAAQVAVHYINTQHGSPFKVFGLQQVHEARAQVSFTCSQVCTVLYCTLLSKDFC